MIDIETLGSSPGCSIISIGAIPFEFDSIIDESKWFLLTIDLQSCIDSGLTIENNTLAWWLNENPKLLTDILKDPHKTSIHDGICKLKRYINIHCNKLYSPWSKGSAFDIPILNYAAKKCNVQLFNGLINERCARTYMSLDSTIKVDNPYKHNPLSDCLTQIKTIQLIYDKYFK